MSGLKLAACPFFFFLARRHFLWKSPRKHSPRQEMLKRQHFERCDHRAVKQNWGVEGQKRWCSALPLLDVASPWPAETQWAWRTDSSRIYVRRKRAAEQSTEAQGEGGCICPVCPHFLIPVVILRKSISRGTAGQGGSTDRDRGGGSQGNWRKCTRFVYRTLHTCATLVHSCLQWREPSRFYWDQIANIWAAPRKQESSRETSLSALLTMPKPLTVWVTINCGKFWKRWEYQTTWPASWETYMQVRKQQLELDMEQQTGSK